MTLISRTDELKEACVVIVTLPSLAIYDQIAAAVGEAA